MNKNTKPEKVGVNLFNTQVYGDKVVIHKCELDKALKYLANNPDPFEQEYYRAGQEAVVRDLLYCIKTGMKRIREKENKNK